MDAAYAEKSLDEKVATREALGFIIGGICYPNLLIHLEEGQKKIHELQSKIERIVSTKRWRKKATPKPMIELRKEFIKPRSLLTLESGIFPKVPVPVLEVVEEEKEEHGEEQIDNLDPE
ncbi:hypothetical protein ACH5RR_006616 [Cinchona calisaya]|uniref:Uncharacterized protein n=1 Tax=Cinchona calisaya TaxID=153742 RepID=A0ABD3APJ6_9GENT